MAPIWFITGVSSGLGFEIALKALEAGFTVVGTVRSRQRAAREVGSIERKGGTCLELDVTDIAACAQVFKKAEQLKGQVDVLVNNAGMSYLGAVEDFTDDEAKAQMEVNFHGPLRLIQAALPGFRKRKSGAIVNITSVAGLDGLPSCGMYAASKFAMEGLSETLARELEAYNVQVLAVEPGAFRTNFLAAFKTSASTAKLGEYQAAKAVLDKFGDYQGSQPGDATKGAARIVEAVAGTGLAGKLKGQVLRLPLGPDCVKRYEVKVKSMSDDLERAREAAMSTDID